MIIERLDELKSWLMKTLGPICDADPEILSRYILALIKKDKPITDLIALCQRELDIFLQERTTDFVENLFATLKAGEFGANWNKTKQPAAANTILKAKNQPNADVNSTSGGRTPGVVERHPSQPGIIEHSNAVLISAAAVNNDTDLRTRRPIEPVKDDGKFGRVGENLYGISGSIAGTDLRDCDSGIGDVSVHRDRKRKLSPQNGSSRNSSSIAYVPKNTYGGPLSERIDRRQGTGSPSRKRYSPAPRNRSRSRSRSRPTDRRRSRSSSGSSSSSSSPSHTKRVRRNERRLSPSHNRVVDGNAQSGTSSNRCRDYDEKGFCVRGDLCPFDHGNDPVVLDDVGIPPSVLCLPGVVPQDLLTHHVPILQPPPGVPPILSGPRQLPVPPVQYHPGMPGPFLQPPPPLPGGMLLPPGVMPPSRLAPPSHVVEPYMPEPFSPKMPMFRQQMLPPPGTGYRHTSHVAVSTASAPSDSIRMGAGDARHGYGLVQQPPPGYTGNSGFSSFVPSSRQGNLVVVPTMEDFTSRDKIKVSEFIRIPSSQPSNWECSSESKPVAEPASSSVPAPSTTVTTTATSVIQPIKKTGPVWYHNTNVPWINKQKNTSNATLELRRVPPDMNTIAKINEHFARFGTLVNLQVAYNGDPEAALVSFASHAQASAAYHCSEPMFNNRFIKIFWHNPDRPNHSGGPQQQTVQMKPIDPEPRQFPAPHQLQLNNKRTVIPPAVSVAKTEPSVTSKPSQDVSAEEPAQKPVMTTSATAVTSTSEVRPASTMAVAASTYVAPPPPSMMKLNCKDQLKKEAMKKGLELQKQKQSLLQRLVQEQKVLLDKIEKNKKMSSEERKTIIEAIKKLASSIDKLRSELSTPIGRGSGGASKSFDVTGFKTSGSTSLVRSTKLVRTHPAVAVSAPTVVLAVPSSSLSAAAVTAVDVAPPLIEKFETAEQEKQETPKNDSESEPSTLANEGSDTSLLRRRVAALKREAASLGLLSGPLASSPLLPLGRGRGQPRRVFAGPLSSRVVDRRPRQLLVTGFAADDKEDVLTHLLTFGAVDNSVIDNLLPSISITYKTRQSAEKAVSDGSLYKGQRLAMAWQSADGILSPKIIPPAVNSEPVKKDVPKAGREAKTSIGDDLDSAPSSDFNLFENDDSDDDDDAILGGDDDDDDDGEGVRSWRH